MNLLNIKPIAILFNWKYFPIIPQLVMLAAYVGIFIGSVTVGNEPRIANHIGNTNLANQLVWRIWWPIVVVLAAVAGRIWCMVCPLELLNSLGSRIGLKKKVPHVLRSGWVITGFYAFILFVAVYYLGLKQAPRALAIYLASVCSIAFLLGLIFEKRSFCSYVCPLGSIIGMYSYIACMQWRTEDETVCSSCKSHDCVSKKNRYKLFGHSCTSNLFPARITDNRDCLLCGNCLKACPDSNFRLSLRMPFRDFFTKIRLKPAEMAILLLLIGFVNNNWEALVFFTLIPLVVCIAVSWKSRREMLNAFMVLVIPTTAAAHMLKAFQGIIWNLPKFKLSFMDPLGVRTATMLADKVLTIDHSWLDPLWRLHDNIMGLLYGTVFAVSVMIIVKSPITEKIGRLGKAALIISVALYIASFYIKINI